MMYRGRSWPRSEAELYLLKSLQPGQNNDMKKVEKAVKNEAMLSEINDKLSEQIEILSETAEQHVNVFEQLEKNVQKLQSKDVDLENSSRRAKIVFYGVK